MSVLMFMFVDFFMMLALSRDESVLYVCHMLGNDRLKLSLAIANDDSGAARGRIPERSEGRLKQY
eukprot:SAG11_NODE_81_length_17673_cov_7.702572_19_plen_65_part_00